MLVNLLFTHMRPNMVLCAGWIMDSREFARPDHSTESSHVQYTR